MSESRVLRAGPLQMIFSGDDLRHIRAGDRTILQRIYVGVRDRNWETVPGKIEDLVMEQRADAFEIAYDSIHRLGDLDFRWHATITGSPAGRLSFALDGKAHSTFLRNRIGFCLHHPLLECAGMPCTVETADGAVERTGFPEFVSPHQVFVNVRAMACEVYRGHDVMPWCGRCGTGLSQMEVAEGRRIAQHTSVFVRFPVVGQEKTALLVWTTTPWTLTSNVAVAVNPQMTYVKVQHGEWRYYVAKANFERDRLQDLQVEGKHETHKLPSIRTILKGTGTIEVLQELPGKDLIGLTYAGPFDELPAQQKPGGVFPFGETGGGKSSAESHRVIAWDEISEAEGTGLVHIAPGCGAEDQQLGKDNQLPFVAPLDESAVFQDGFGLFTGKNANEVADDVVAALKAKGLLVARERYHHVYPHCWRCKSELVFRPVDEWFIRMDWRGFAPRARS